MLLFLLITIRGPALLTLLTASRSRRPWARLAFVLAAVLGLVLIAALERATSVVERLDTLPVGLSDAIDHPALLEYIDLEMNGGTRYQGLRFIRAVGLHVAGRAEEAADAYRELSDDARAERNLGNLTKGLGPVEFPVPEDLLPASRTVLGVARDWIQLPARAGGMLGSPQIRVTVLIGCLVTLMLAGSSLALILGVPGPARGVAAGTDIRGLESKVLLREVLAPGGADLAMGRPIRSALICAGLALGISFGGFVLLSTEDAHGVVGLVSTWASGVGLELVPVPPSLEAESARNLYVFWNLPGQVPFLGVVIASFLLALGAQAMSVRRWYREREPRR